tara:strand:- start:9852 stop:10754 length:903 start_codon:yes stop_codon:yes gene_type:complete
MEFLKELGIDTTAERIENIKLGCPDVYENESMIFCPLTDNLIEDGFFTISNSNGFIHGKVSNKNSVVAMTTLIDIAYQVNLDTKLNLNFANAKLEYFKAESVAELTIPLGKSEFRTRNGFNDMTEVFLFIKTGFGGVACSEVGIYTKRFICTNGLEIRHGLSYFKCKHTEKMNEKLKVFFGEILPQFTNSVHDFTQLAKKFDSKDITAEQIENFKQKFFNYKKGDEIGLRKGKQLKAFNKGMKVEMDRVGQTVWGLLQSATHYTNHGHEFAKNKDFIVTGTGATLNATAEKYVLNLVKEV